MSKARTLFYAARCLICLKKFAVPKLSEFSFGEFLYSSKDGKLFANYSVYDELDISEMIDDKINQNTIGKRINEIKKTELKYKLIGKIADMPDDMDGYITGKYVCPRCGSKIVFLNDKKKIKAERLPRLQFRQFKSLTEKEREELIQQKISKELN
ncbi:MAG: hypothetical protein KJ607_07110 [Bacteroidetes bacterium]|nr:hypothetical protein [Bacteroidota bacterium]